MAGNKHLVNSVSDAVNDSLLGLLTTFPQLELHKSKRVVLALKWNESNSKVAIVSGGGSGHEPFSAGFVGSGMLDASVSGSIFASPPTSHVLHAIKCVTKFNKNAGCLVIIPNYTGDCLNFGLASEKARMLDIKIENVIVGDDCSIPKAELGIAGRRALPGILFVIKIAGALANKGYSLKDITSYANLVSNNTSSCSIGLTACSLPGQDLMFTLNENEVEFGQGIHGEAGYKRMKLQSASDIVSLMLAEIVKDLDLKKVSNVVVLINNFGALSQLEQSIVVKETVDRLELLGVSTLRAYSGALMTSLNSSGVHIAVFRLPEKDQELLLDCLDEKTDAPKWPACEYSKSSNPGRKVYEGTDESSKTITGPSLSSAQEIKFKNCLSKACEQIIKEEKFINDLDSGCGDGDCGSTLKNLASEIARSLEKLTWSHPASLLSELAEIAEDRMGGTSGALYSLMLTTAALKISTVKADGWVNIWSQAWQAGIDCIKKYSKANLGDKTMLDVLIPCAHELKKNLNMPLNVLSKKISQKALESAEKTKNMLPKAGRASYVKQEKYLKGMDAGAYAACVWIKSIASNLE